MKTTQEKTGNGNEVAQPKIGKAYAVKQFNEVVKKLVKTDLINDEEKQSLQELARKVSGRYIGIEYA